MNMFAKAQAKGLTHNPFRGISEAPITQGGNWIIPGVHPKLRVNALKIIDSTKSNTQMFIVELEVLESATMAVGASCSWCVDFKHASAMGNIKAFDIAVLNCAESDVDEEIANSLLLLSQAELGNAPTTPEGIQAVATLRDMGIKINGTIVRCDAVNIKTKRNTDFTKCNWRHVSAAV